MAALSATRQTKNRRSRRQLFVSDNLALSGITLGMRVIGVVARVSPLESPRCGPETAKFALDRRTALALNDRTRAPRGRQIRRKRARRGGNQPEQRIVPPGVELLRSRVGLPETDETGIVETRTGLGSLFVTPEPPPRRSSPLIDQAEPAVEGGAAAFNAPCRDFRLKPGCAPGERTPLAPQEIGTAGTLERDRPANDGPPSPPPRSRRRCSPNRSGPRNRNGLPAKFVRSMSARNPLIRPESAQ
jgi:hypothetical protein